VTKSSPERAEDADSTRPDPITTDRSPAKQDAKPRRALPPEEAEIKTASGARPANLKIATARRFRGAITRTIAGTIIPGLGLIGTRRNGLGIALTCLTLIGGAGLGWLAWNSKDALIRRLLNVELLVALGTGLGVLAVLWGCLILGTYRTSRPRKLDSRRRLIGALVVAAMTAFVSVPLSVVSGYAFETARLSGDLFGSERKKPSQTRPSIKRTDPWRDIARVNVLLLGGDSGEGRDNSLGIRTDTIMIASIDTKTGNTVIIQIPRNLQYAPFPPGSALAKQYPNGFNDGGPSYINSIWLDVPTANPELFEDTAYPGADALKWAIQGVTGLKMDYFALVDIDGLIRLVDAMGGVTVNVNYPIAKHGSDEMGDCGFGGWILEGPNQKLNGDDAMWFARSRCNTPGGDFGRMKRQSCLVKAIIDQADPAVMATRYEQIARAAGNMVMTDVPKEHLEALIDLSLRVQKGQISRLTFVHGENGFYSDQTNWSLVRTQVAEALQRSVPDAPSTPSAADQTTSQPTSQQPVDSIEPQPTQAAEPDQPEELDPQPSDAATASASTSQPPTENVADACAYHPEEPAWVHPTVPRRTPSPSMAATPAASDTRRR